MPDYFDRLLARSVPGFPAAGPVVRPRLPQIFEPAGPEPEYAEPFTVPVPAAPPVVGAPGPPGPRGRAGQATHTSLQAAPAVPQEPTPTAPELVTVESSKTIVAAEHTSHEVVREPVIEQRLTAVNVAVRQGEPVAELRPQHTTVVVPVPVAQPRQTPAPVTHRAETPQPQAVHVSIGRIEVTATSPERRQPPRAATKRPEPVLSLDRYLAREDDRR
jgi:hypothetical protein